MFPRNSCMVNFSVMKNLIFHIEKFTLQFSGRKRNQKQFHALLENYLIYINFDRKRLKLLSLFFFRQYCCKKISNKKIEKNLNSYLVTRNMQFRPSQRELATNMTTKLLLTCRFLLFLFFAPKSLIS